MPASVLTAELKLCRLNTINPHGLEKQLLTWGKKFSRGSLCHEYPLGAFTLQYIVLTTDRDKLE